MTLDQCNEALKDNVSESISNALDLRAILGEERDALERKDTDSLSDTAIRKRLLISKLEELDNARARVSESLGYGANPDDISLLAAQCDSGDLLLESWQRFLDVALECRQMNACNGAVIRTRQEQIRVAIRLLRDGTTESDMYGPDGQNRGDNGNRVLAEA